jgi:hypothetical protein
VPQTEFRVGEEIIRTILLWWQPTSTSSRVEKVSRDLHNLIKFSLAISRQENSSNAEENFGEAKRKLNLISSANDTEN